MEELTLDQNLESQSPTIQRYYIFKLKHSNKWNVDILGGQSRWGQFGYLFISLESIQHARPLIQTKLYQMITDNTAPSKEEPTPHKPPRSLRIVKQTQNGLIIAKGKEELIFKKYLVKDEAIPPHLQKRFHLKHQSLIHIKSIEYGNQQNESTPHKEQLCCGILFQKYTKTMEQSIKENISFNHQQVIETFTPIRNAVDFLVHQNYDPGELQYSSIVCTEDYQIKLIDPILHETALAAKERERFSTKIYWELAELMYSLLFPKESHIKSWPSRYQIAKKKLTTAHFHFFHQIYKKMGLQATSLTKCKKIKKERVKPSNKKTTCKDQLDSPKKNIHEALANCQSGKQNVIIQ